MTKFKPFKLTFKYALKKAYNYWKRGTLQVKQGGSGELIDEYYGKCAIGCALPMSILKKAKENGLETPVQLKKKGLIKAKAKDIRKLTKMMEAHDEGVDSMRNFFIRNKVLKR